jgi:hypothetical protein
MNIPKHVIVARLRERNLNARADFVERELPDEIDPTRHTGLLATLNLTVEDLTEDKVANPPERTP